MTAQCSSAASPQLIDDVHSGVGLDQDDMKLLKGFTKCVVHFWLAELAFEGGGLKHASCVGSF